ncbi:MAG TPA: hypothetical protein VGW12_13865 [Pyrinomonadaceae bacterium]|nr:hypothetical protein [Pyrinomonadaceae bacterium]
MRRRESPPFELQGGILQAGRLRRWFSPAESSLKLLLTLSGDEASRPIARCEQGI